MAVGGILRQRAEEETLRSPEDLQRNRNLSNLGAGLMEAGFEQLGSPKTGKAVAEYLRQEWWRQEAQTFQATVGKDTADKLNQSMSGYKNRTKLTTEMGIEGQDPAELRKGYYSEYDPDGAPVPTSFIPADDFMAVNQHLNSSASDLVGGLQSLSMEYMDAAGQYPNNPLIEAKAKNLMTHIQTTFEGQLTAYKMADDRMKAQSDMMDMEQKNREAQLAQETFPLRKKLEVAKLEADQVNLDKEKIVTRAQIDRGRELAAARGLEIEAMDENDLLQHYYKHKIDLDEAAKKAEIAVKAGKNLLPNGVNLNNLGDYLVYDVKGQGILKSFMNEEARETLKNPDIKAELERQAQEQGSMSFSKLPKEGDPGKSIVGQDNIIDSVLKDNPDVYEKLREKAIRRATEYLIDTDQIGGPVGVKGVRIPGVDKPITIFEDAEEAMRLTNPELFTAENEDKYADKLADEDFSGDPEDPFGPPAEPEGSPVAEGAPVKEQNDVISYAKWYDEFAADPDVPLGTKKKQARAGIRAVSNALKNLATRQSISEYGLPSEEYRQQVTGLLTLRSNLYALTHIKEGEIGPATISTDLGKVYDAFATTSKTIYEMGQESNRSFIESVEGGMDYLMIPGRKQATKTLKGILQPQNRKKQLLEATEASVPYWMASPEEKQARMERFNRTTQTGRL